MSDWKNWEQKFSKGLRRQKDFHTSSCSRMIPHNLLGQLEIKNEEYRKSEKRKKEQYRDQKERVIYSVSYRRKWVHHLRSQEDQDEVLNDYKDTDDKLTLDWDLLMSKE